MFKYPIFSHYEHSSENQLAATAAAHNDPSQSVIIVWDQLFLPCQCYAIMDLYSFS